MSLTTTKKYPFKIIKKAICPVCDENKKLDYTVLCRADGFVAYVKCCYECSDEYDEYEALIKKSICPTCNNKKKLDYTVLCSGYGKKDWTEKCCYECSDDYKALIPV